MHGMFAIWDRAERSQFAARDVPAPLSIFAGVQKLPRLGRPLADLALDGALFGLLCLPGLEFARRRFGLPLGFARSEQVELASQTREGA